MQSLFVPMSRNRALLISLAREDRSKTRGREKKRKKGEAWKKEEREENEEKEEEEEGKKKGEKRREQRARSTDLLGVFLFNSTRYCTVTHRFPSGVTALPRGKLHTFTISCSEKRSHFFPRKCSDTAWKTGETERGNEKRVYYFEKRIY